MTPSAILLIICLFVFSFLALTFSIYIIKLLLKDRKVTVEMPSAKIARFNPTGNEVQEEIKTVIPHYNLAKAE